MEAVLSLARVCGALENPRDALHMFGAGSDRLVAVRAHALGFSFVCRAWTRPCTAALVLKRDEVHYVFFTSPGDAEGARGARKLCDDLYLDLATKLGRLLGFDGDTVTTRLRLTFVAQGIAGAAAQIFVDKFVHSCAAFCDCIEEVVTFGSPPAGDRAWTEQFTVRTRRFVVRGDARVTDGCYAGKLQFLAAQPRVFEQERVLEKESDAWTNFVEDAVGLASPLLDFFPSFGVFNDVLQVRGMAPYIARLALIHRSASESASSTAFSNGE